jgi:hypothetical protein
MPSSRPRLIPTAETVRHDLVEIILIAFLAVLCGAHHWKGAYEKGEKNSPK